MPNTKDTRAAADFLKSCTNQTLKELLGEADLKMSGNKTERVGRLLADPNFRSTFLKQKPWDPS